MSGSTLLTKRRILHPVGQPTGVETLRDDIIKFTDGYNLGHGFMKPNNKFGISHGYNRTRGGILFGGAENAASILRRKIDGDQVERAEHKFRTRYQMNWDKGMWMSIVDDLNGYVPMKLEMLPEGIWAPAGTPIFQVRNTEEGYEEINTWFECVYMWNSFATGVASRAFEIWKYQQEKKAQYGYDDSFDMRVHDFSLRGHRSPEDMYWASKAFQLFFIGTDVVPVLWYTPDDIPATSIPAQGHKVVQPFDNEYEAYIKSIDYAASDKGITALVIDTYNPWRFINEYLPTLGEYAKSKGVHIVDRPDSGKTLEQAIRIYEVAERHHFTNVSVIIGEGQSLAVMKSQDIELENRGVPLKFVFNGLGSGLYNDIDRDYMGFSMKTAYSNDADRMKFSTEFKRSIPGEVRVEYNHEGLLQVLPGDSYSGRNLYEDVYFHDHTTKEPQIYLPDYHDIRDLARTQIETSKQEKIILSNGIKDKIKVIGERMNVNV
jgi:nicotinamide phosphoribosyltransferase